MVDLFRDLPWAGDAKQRCIQLLRLIFDEGRAIAVRPDRVPTKEELRVAYDRLVATDRICPRDVERLTDLSRRLLPQGRRDLGLPDPPEAGEVAP